ncbi:hypothetical protein ADL22_12300 [Streptomyces sp. NRRL F-4489]|uniref:hypothetical protein n=1 Tax=Streptomyces sp. NRRL F-4489 TaxID=1609095 RepID=UPI0007492CD4|nr:hypothetical protein [Streptomyces sp. NRRL F-4489]KUL44718.1 hypothetical protein ADL22_12300 [Streptomyces sp. NRRL F-4489]
MIYTKQVTERFNLGSYEHIEVTASVQFDPVEESITDVEDALDAMLSRERLFAKKFTTEENSVAHVHPALTNLHTKRS